MSALHGGAEGFEAAVVLLALELGAVAARVEVEVVLVDLPRERFRVGRAVVPDGAQDEPAGEEDGTGGERRPRPGDGDHAAATSR